MTALRDAITCGDLAPGQRLIERDITEELGVSRATLREALGELRTEGLVELIPQRGAVVATLTEDEAVDLYEVRIALEELVVRRFASRATARQIEALHRSLDRIEEVIASDPEIGELLEAKDQFFGVLLEGAGSFTFDRMIASIQARIRLLRATSMSAPGRKEQSLRELRGIASLLTERDADRAAEQYAAHLREAARISIDRWRAERIAPAAGQ